LGSGCIDPRFLDLGTSWSTVINFTPGQLYPVERAPGSNWIGGWMGPRTGLDDLKRKFLTLPGLELDISVVQPQIRSEVLIAVTNMILSFWGITPRTSVKVNVSFGETYNLHLQDRRES
jgi:hypothetical protein